MPRHSKAVYRRRRLAVFGSASLVVLVSSALAVIGIAPLPAAAVTTVIPTDLTNAEASVSVPPFGVTAVEAPGYGVLVGTDLDTPRPIASIAKVVTALVVLDEHPVVEGQPEELITFDQSDVDRYALAIANAESRAEVESGYSISVGNLITVMLVDSANNYSWTLARWAFGSEDAFLSAATTWCQENGLSATTLTDSSGLNAGTVSSLRDLLAIGKLALANPLVAAAVGTVSANIAPAGAIENTNKLLGTAGITGIKTGTTDEAGACLLYSAAIPVGTSTVNIIGVTLAAPSHEDLNVALIELITSLQAGFHEVSPLSAGTLVASALTDWEESTGLVATQSVSDVVWSNTPVLISLPSTIPALGSTGSVAAAATVTIGDRIVDIPLARDTTIGEPGLAWRLAHLGELLDVA